MKRTRGICLFILLTTVSLCVSPARAGNILWDDSHDNDGDELTGNFSGFAAAMATAGHTVVELNGSPGAITPQALSGKNAFFLWDAELALTSAEITTLHNFVAAGGGLFVAWDAGTDLTSNNALLAPYGLSMNGVTQSSASVSGFVAHPITVGVNTIQTSFGTTVGATGSAIDLTLGGGTSDILAVSGAPNRVVVFGDTGTFDNGAPSTTGIGLVDNAKLVVNIANFLVAPEPTSGVLLGVAVIASLPTLRRRAK